MSIRAIEAVVDLIEMGGVVGQADIVKCLRSALAEVEKQEPHTEWLVCPNCKYKSPYSPIKAKTNEEDAERVTKQARAALEREKQEPTRETMLQAARKPEKES